MSELAQELQISRQRISQMLRALEGKGELILGREKIEIPAFERLLQSV
jgi:DNA-binding MarR family transcriptional regulator